MNTGPGGTKKPALCRYFVASGSCFYGTECQFAHSALNNNNHLSPLESESQQQDEDHADPCKSVSASTESDDVGSSRLHFLTGASKLGGSDVRNDFNTIVPKLRSAKNSMDTFDHLPKLDYGDPFVHHNGFLSESKLNNYLSGRTPLTSSNNRSDKFPLPISSPLNDKFYSNHQDIATLQLVNSLANLGIDSTPNPAANEFVPRSVTPVTMVGNAVVSVPDLTANSSYLGFDVPSSLDTGDAFITNHSQGANDISPLISPSLSPSHSPHSKRRIHSPLSYSKADEFIPASTAATIQKNVDGTTYFYPAENGVPHPRDPVVPNVVVPNYIMFPFTPSHISQMIPKANAPSFFMPDELRLEILRHHSITMSQMDPEQYADFPMEVDNYHNLLPLEARHTTSAEKSSVFGYITSTYKASNNKTGVAYCLRRIHGFRSVYPKVMALVDMWKKTQHSNIVQMREVFTTKAFGDHCVVFVYDYHPGAETLMSKHFNRTRLNGMTSNLYCPDLTNRSSLSSQGSSNEPRQHAGLLPESLIWAYIVQLCSALRSIHTAGLACQSLHPSKIILTGKSRIRINCCGIYDVLAFDPNQGNPLTMMPHFQQDDLTSLGKLVLALACNSLEGVQPENIQSSMDLVARSYSSDLRNLVLYLLTNQNRVRSTNDIMPMIGARFFTQLDAAQMRSDVLENELAKEVECGRLFRLLAKMGTINERPEFNFDQSWCETGDRYMLKLFRDYLFHQVTEDGRPWLDLAHIVQCLNKLDAGIPEKICLMSRDEQNVLVVSYAELKKCFESSFNEILQATGNSAKHTINETAPFFDIHSPNNFSSNINKSI